MSSLGKGIEENREKQLRGRHRGVTGVTEDCSAEVEQDSTGFAAQQRAALLMIEGTHPGTVRIYSPNSVYLKLNPQCNSVGNLT